MLAAVVTAYTLLFTGENLLDVSLVVYLGPIVAMAYYPKNQPTDCPG